MTEKQYKLLKFMHERISETGVTPSYDTMRREMGLKAKSGIARLVVGLETLDMIYRIPNRARSIEITRKGLRYVGGQIRVTNIGFPHGCCPTCGQPLTQGEAA